MMRKHVSRLLALVLVLCMVVLCVPVRAQATVNLTRPENITDEEWEVLRKKLLAQLAAKQAEETGSITEVTLPETDSLSKSDSGNLTVTDTADVKTGVTAPEAAKDQTVSVELPAKADDEIKTEDVGDKKVVTNEYDTTIEVKNASGETAEKDVEVKESYDLDAKITAVETQGTGDKNVTDITYDVSLNGSVSATDKEDGSDVVVKSDVVNDIDAVANEAAKEEKVTAPQYKVDMSINGMDEKKVTRVTHTYTTPKETTTPDETPSVETHEEYYYNAENGTEDTTKKYFTIEEKVVEQKDTEGNIVSTVKEKVVSLWTSFLGIFHITTDAFEGANKATYGSLTEAAAADANTGKTVEMLRDYETNDTATVGKSVAVDLNGYQYTNSSENAAVKVNGTGTTVAIENGDLVSDGDGVQVEGTNNKFSLKNIFLRSNADNDASGNTAAVSISGSGNTVDVDDSHIDGNRSTYGIQDTSTGKNAVNIDGSIIQGKTSVALKNTDADIRDSYLRSTTGAALSVDGNSKDNEVVITNGRFESGKAAANIYAKDKDDIASITVKGGRFTDPTGLCSYVPYGYAAICRNDGSYFLYEVVSTDYAPTREGYRFLGYTDGNGNAISLAEAYRKGVIAYAQWKEIPETTAKPAALITAKPSKPNHLSRPGRLSRLA